MSLPGILVRNWRLKSISLALATLLWVTMQLRDEADTGRRDLPDVEVRVENADSTWRAFGQPAPATVSIGVQGTFGDLLRAALARPVVVIRWTRFRGRTRSSSWSRTGVENLDQNRVAIDGFNPSTVRLRFERNTSEPVPVSYRTIGAVPDSLAMTGDLQVNPPLCPGAGTAVAGGRNGDGLSGALRLGRPDRAGEVRRWRWTRRGLGDVSVRPPTAVLTVNVASRGRRELAPLPVELPTGAGELEATPASVVRDP